MNKIICEDCEKEIKLNKNSIESKYLPGGIKINFFRCTGCKKKYLIDVTDKETREKQFLLREWAEQRKKALDIVIEGMSEEQLKEVTMLADECLINAERLEAEIKESKAALKVKYEGEL